MQNIRNFVQATADIATAGQPTAEQFKLIAQEGYEYVINLGMPDHAHALLNEGALVAEQGMTYVHIPVHFNEPTQQQVTDFCLLMKLLRGRKVFVHCIMNFRVAAFMYHYFTKVEGLSEGESKSIMFEHWDLDHTWTALMQWDAHDLKLPALARSQVA